jgi:hypothetical protein
MPGSHTSRLTIATRGKGAVGHGSRNATEQLRTLLQVRISPHTPPPADERLVAYMSTNIKTILLVDDEPVVREVLGDMLTLHGYTVLVAEDYYTALETAKHHDGTDRSASDRHSIARAERVRTGQEAGRLLARAQSAADFRVHGIGDLPILPG